MESNELGSKVANLNETLIALQTKQEGHLKDIKRLVENSKQQKKEYSTLHKDHKLKENELARALHAKAKLKAQHETLHGKHLDAIERLRAHTGLAAGINIDEHMKKIDELMQQKEEFGSTDT